MKKFFKGLLASAMVIPCVTGLVACGEKVDKTEVAYKEVFAEVETIANKFSAIETVGTEFQLNINMSINAQQLVNGVANPEGVIAANIKAALGARHSQNNKEIFGDVSLVGDNNTSTSLLSAYMVDDIGEDEYTELGLLTSEQWEALKSALYINADGVYVAANTSYDEEATYYMATEDVVHVYLNSNMSELTEVVGFDITELVPALNDGKLYGTLYTGEEIIEDTNQSDDAGMDFDAILAELPSADDYATFKQELAKDGMELTRVASNGDVGICISGQGSSVQLIAKANGGLKLVMDMVMPLDSSSSMDMDIVIDIDVVDQIEESYIPTDFTGYGDAKDLEAWLDEMMSNMPF